MESIYLINVNCGCLGILEGCFIAHDFEIENLIGTQIQVGDLSVMIRQKHIKKIPGSELIVSELHQTTPENLELKTISGFNPLNPRVKHCYH